MSLNNVSSQSILELITNFQEAIISNSDDNIMDVIDVYSEKIRKTLDIDYIVTFQTVLIGNFHEIVFSSNDINEHPMIKEELIKQSFIKRRAFIETINNISIITEKIYPDCPLINTSIFKYAIAIPLKNIYHNSGGNGMLILANRDQEILLTSKTTQIINIISNVITIGINKYRLHQILNRESKFVKESLDTLKNPICVFDNEGIILRINNSFSRLTGLLEQDTIGFRIFDILPLNNHNAIEDYLYYSDKDENMDKNYNTPKFSYATYIKKDGSSKLLKKYFNNLIENNVILHMLVLEDITEETKKNNEYEFLGLHDALTGLYNRNYYQELLRNLRNQNKYPISVIVGDINGLKIMNDIFGHEYGDQIIIDISSILKQHCSHGEIIRVGGDEFYVFLEKTTDKQAKQIITKITDSCYAMFENYHFVGISLGSFTLNNSDEYFDTAIRKAEAEMYYNKSVDQDNIKKESLKKFKQMYEEKCELGVSHITRLVKLAKEFGKFLKLRKSEVEDVINACEIHDIGKVAINKKIINKSTAYTLEEKEIMMSHCSTGYKIATLSYETSHLARIILSHHEYWNGSGYPQGLIGDQIPYLARIVSIIDYYDITKYGKSNVKPITELNMVLEKMEQEKGKMLDPSLLKSFINFIKNSKKVY